MARSAFWYLYSTELVCCASRISTVDVVTLCTTNVITLGTVCGSGFVDDVSSTLCTLLLLLS